VFLHFGLKFMRRCEFLRHLSEEEPIMKLARLKRASLGAVLVLLCGAFATTDGFGQSKSQQERKAGPQSQSSQGWGWGQNNWGWGQNMPSFSWGGGGSGDVDPITRQSIGARGKSGFVYTPIPRQTVLFDGSKYSPGTVIVNTAERRLYYVVDNNWAIKYGIGVGRDGFRWGGTHSVTQKKEWPDWIPPEEMRKRQPGLPAHMKGGPDNPLGARALYLGSTLYRIHGSNEPETIGQAVSSGCFRMTNEDVIDLYNRVKVGAVVHVLHQR
jgi:lipoprotein-anchoring transpeptidase ErfK/SrfK